MRILQSWSTKTVLLVLLVISVAAAQSAAYAKPNRIIFIYDSFDTAYVGDRNNRSYGVWNVSLNQWGQDGSGNPVNNGVVPENVSAHTLVDAGQTISVLDIEAHGDNYSGSTSGVVRSNGQLVPGGTTRVGGAVTTIPQIDAVNAIRYEARMKILPVLGATSAMWTYHYHEDGNTIYNHEIDIEFPGRSSESATDYSLNKMMTTTWRDPDTQFTSIFNNDTSAYPYSAFHVYRFDWYRGLDGTQPKVEWYIDGNHIRTITTNVPWIGDEFTIGTWFPNLWAGDPSFDTAHMYIDWVKVSSIATLPDLTAPSAPTALSIASQADSSVTLTWNAAKDAFGIKAYQVYVNGVLSATTSATTATVSIDPSTASTIYVVALDRFDNRSGPSNTVTIYATQ